VQALLYFCFTAVKLKEKIMAYYYKDMDIDELADELMVLYRAIPEDTFLMDICGVCEEVSKRIKNGRIVESE